MKKNTHIYSELGDYAPEHKSEPAWKIVAEHLIVYALISIGLVVGSKLLWSLATFDYCPLFYNIPCL